MKHLFMALICTAIGFSASASDLTPKKNNSTTIKAEVKTNNKKTEIKVSENKNETLGLYRRQRVFTFNDDCGNQMTVWVSGPDNASWVSQYDTATSYAAHQMVQNGGCFR